MAVFKVGHFATLVRKAVVAVLLDDTHEGTIVDERLIHLLVLAVGVVVDAFRMAVVGVVCSCLQPRQQRGKDTCCQREVHQLVLMA